MQKVSFKELKIMVNTIKQYWPNKNSDFYKIALSIKLLRLFLGNDWVNSVIFNKDNDKKNIIAREFMKSKMNGFQWQERTRRLAERIYNLQNINNIEGIIKKIKQGNLESRFAEIEAATHFYRFGVPFEFVKPLGTLGQDFDIKLLTKPVVNCEVKHKIERIKRDKKTIIRSLKKTLKKARLQVPENKPSLFLIKIPEEWNKKDSFIVNFLNDFFKENKSKNVLGIIFRWEERDSKNEGIFYWKYSLIRNNSFLPKEKNIQDILYKLDNPSYKNWINFKDII